MVHKLRGELVTRKDPKGRRTVFDRLAKLGLPDTLMPVVSSLTSGQWSRQEYGWEPNKGIPFGVVHLFTTCLGTCPPNDQICGESCPATHRKRSAFGFTMLAFRWRWCVVSTITAFRTKRMVLAAAMPCNRRPQTTSTYDRARWRCEGVARVGRQTWTRACRRRRLLRVLSVRSKARPADKWKLDTALGGGGGG